MKFRHEYDITEAVKLVAGEVWQMASIEANAQFHKPFFNDKLYFTYTAARNESFFSCHFLRLLFNMQPLLF